MTEREKMIAGMLYNPTDSELTALREKVRQACRDFDRTDENEEEKRCAILDGVLKSHKSFFTSKEA